MSKFFVVSDIHSYYKEFIEALNKSGFDKENKDHFLVTCGDCFDRGLGSEQVLNYLMSVDRWIGIKGNHEELLLDCINRGYWYDYDKSNGTFQTICDLAPNAQTFEMACSVVQERTKDFMSKLVDYFETEKYIFVHSWIPLIIEDDYPKYYTRDREYHFNSDWRNATEKEWKYARWGNPFEIALQGLNQTGKTIVFGHFHCSAGHKMLGHCKNEFDGDAIWKPCFAEGIIGIDRCTPYTRECNVIVLEDNFLSK
jgi:serine/threonine protein phosphatase 1